MRKTIRERILFFLTIGFAVAGIFGATIVSSFAFTYIEGARTYNALTKYVAASQKLQVEPTYLPHGMSLPHVDFYALRNINENVAAWLVLEGTNINHPVVQGSNNYRYLNHLFDGTKNRAGTLFVDAYNLPNFEDCNTIIYGHHMQDGSMFSALLNYRCQFFFNKHPRALLLTPTSNYLIEFFAGYTTDVNSQSWRLEFYDDDEMQAWIDASRQKSDFVSDVAVNAQDKIITLATCTTARTLDDSRYVVVGRLIPLL